MSRSMRFNSLVLLCMLACAPAFAQDDPELGYTAPSDAPTAATKKKPKRAAADKPAEPAPAPVTPEAPPTDTSATVQASTSTSLDSGWEKPPSSEDENEDEKAKGDSDHEAVVGRFGVGLLGLAEIPVGVGDPGGVATGGRTTSSPLTAPVLGARYWLSERFGIEAGLGFAFSSGSVKITGLSDGDNASTTAFALHAGVPIAVTWGKHYNLIAVPYMGIGISSATDTRATPGTGDDVFGKGFLFEGGLKGGVEVQLGSIGLEGLALQITGGIRLRYESTSINVPTVNAMGMATGDVDIDKTNVSFGTSGGTTLGSAVLGSIAAIYYF